MMYLWGFKYKFSKSLSWNFLKLSCLLLGHSGGLRGLYAYAIFSNKMKDCILLTPLALILWRGGGRHKSSQLHTVSHQSIFSSHCTKRNNLVTPPSFHICLFKRPDDVLCMSDTLLSLWGTRGLWHFYLGTLRWWESCACMESNYCGGNPVL